MHVFISWSGDTSKKVAAAVRDWLPMVIQSAKPYMSDLDNEAGSRWGSVVSAELEASDFGIICLTPSNIDSRWINFEAGALSKAVGKARVVPLLFQLKPTDVGPPLSQFMMKLGDKEGVLAILNSINSGIDADRRLEGSILLRIFEPMWPELEQRLAEASKTDISQHLPRRTERELLEEMLELLRSNVRGRAVAQGGPIVLAEEFTLSLEDPMFSEDGNVMRRLREIVGPEGSVVAVGGMLVLRIPRAGQLSEDDQSSLRNLTGLLMGAGIQVVQADTEDGHASGGP